MSDRTTSIYGRYDIAVYPTIISEINNGLYSGLNYGDVGDIYLQRLIVFEHNAFVLDGSTLSRNFYDNTMTLSYFSNIKSDINGYFSTNPYVLYETENPISSIGIKFNNYSRVLDIKITWYDEAMTILSEKEMTLSEYETYSIDAWENPVKNYKFYKIEALRTVPYSYFREISYSNGGSIYFRSDTIKEAKLLSGSSISSENTQISTLTFSAVDKNNYFSFSSESSILDYFKKGQALSLDYYLNGKTVYGYYFINSISSKKGIVTFNATDVIGFIDEVQFNGVYCNGDTISNIIEDINTYIYDNCGAAFLFLRDDIGDVELQGVIRPTSMRNALQEIMFAIGAKRTLYNNAFYMDYQTRLIASDVKKENKISTEVSKKEYVSAIKINYSNWTHETTYSDLVTETLTVGTHKVTFNTPASDLVVTGGAITEAGDFYAIITVSTEGEVTISGKKYIEEETSYTASIDTSALADVGVTKEFTSSVCDYTMAKAMAERLLDHYQLRLQINTKFLMDGTEELGSWAFVEDANGGTDYIAGFEELDIDFTGGVVANAKLVGYYNHQDEYDFMGTDELYTGTEGLF